MTIAHDAASTTSPVAGWRPLCRDRSLTRRYDSAARAWHRRIARLGYIDAYGSLIASGEQALAAAMGQRRLSVLDAGAGTGAFAVALMGWLSRVSPRAHVSVDLLDPSQPMLDEAVRNLAGSRCRARGMCQLIQSLRGRGQTYDVVLCAHVIEHATDPARELSILRSVLNPGGVLLLALTKPSWLTRLLQLRWHHGAFDEPSARELLRAAGFRRCESLCFPKGPPMLTSLGFVAIAPCDGDESVPS